MHFGNSQLKVSFCRTLVAGHFNAGIQASVLSAANQSAAAAATSSTTSAAAAACTYPSAAAAASTAAANQMMVNDPSAFRINMAAFGRTLGTSRSYFPFDNSAFKTEAPRPAGYFLFLFFLWKNLLLFCYVCTLMLFRHPPIVRRTTLTNRNLEILT